MLTDRKAQLALIWKHTHADFKGKDDDGTRTVLVLRTGGTTRVPLESLTDEEAASKLPKLHYVTVIDPGTEAQQTLGAPTTHEEAARVARRRISKFGERADVMKVLPDGNLTTEF